MPKYYVALVLLYALMLENNRIYSRLHACSQPSGRDAEAAGLHSLRQQQTHVTRQQQQMPQQQQRHAVQRAQQRAKSAHLKQAEASNEEEDAHRRYNARLRRHLQHQIEHMNRQERSYHRSKPRLEELRTMPRIWQHLLDMDYEDVEPAWPFNADEQYHMFGDDPINAELEALALRAEPKRSEENLIPELPPDIPPTTHFNENEIYKPQTNTAQAKAVQYVPEVAALAAGKQKTAVGCPKCESNQHVEHITEEELTRLRIEFVKQQILEKLRLKERPNVSAVGLPRPIYEGVTIEPQDDGNKNKDLDDYYARTSKKFIFLKREYRECQRLDEDQPTICFSFKIDDADADSFDVSTAVLWLFKNKQNRTQGINDAKFVQQTIVVSEVQQQLESKYLPIAKPIAIQTVDVQDEWMKIDIEWPIKRWFGEHDLSHIIQISCESCNIDAMDEMISVDKDYRPFIMVDTQNRRRTARSKRSINCSVGVTECCREKLYISFDEIGWGDWIIQPRGYDAYFCRGSCSSIASVTQSSSHHSTFLAKVLSSKRGQRPLELIPCCTAKQYSSLQLVFMDSNNTATQKTFPNMVVESCGCR